MKNFLLAVTLFVITTVVAQDTTIVQTLDFNDITKRKGWYFFPEDTTYEKVLMYYTLKCDAATTQDNYACGEWDYTTYTNLYEYKNIGQSYYGVNGAYPDTIGYTNLPTNTLYQSYQDSVVYDVVTSESDFVLGAGTLSLSHPLNTSLSNAKTQYLFTVAELGAAGLVAGNIDKMKLDITSLGWMAHACTACAATCRRR